MPENVKSANLSFNDESNAIIIDVRKNDGTILQVSFRMNAKQIAFVKDSVQAGLFQGQ